MAILTREQFERGVSLVKEALDYGWLRLRFMGTSGIPRFDVADLEAFSALLDNPNDLQNVMVPLFNELPNMLLALLNDTRDDYLIAKMSEVKDDALKLALQQEYSYRLDWLNAEMVTPRLVQRYQLHQRGMSWLISDCTGEVVTQIYHTSQKPAVGPYVQIALWIEELKDATLSYLFPASADTYGMKAHRHKLMLECDEVDLDFLINTLTSLREQLIQKVEEEEDYAATSDDKWQDDNENG